ncbi:hypothetical protein PanWU01x14_116200 [Parasponia andersonii]|uniref:Uncharacterized protein n=1 Tax=Parasponia andersonii TaxID=3476 RepID=A0A2P5CX30_PARAD|nr:hypothetical protein PanWU01x14_116200 [Parasponia andersonii]
MGGSDQSLGGSTSWNFHFVKNLNDREVPLLLVLLNRLEPACICPNLEDRGVWVKDSSECFSIKSAFACLSNDSNIAGLPHARIFWKAPIPSKVKDFRTEHKVFLLSIINGGQSLKVVERNRVNDFAITMELGVQGVPSGAHNDSWKEFMDRLAIVIRRRKHPYESQRRLDASDNTIKPHNTNGNELNARDVTKSASISKVADGVSKGREDPKKDWRKALVVYRQDLDIQWRGYKPRIEQET